ncbi:hypothetical protein OBV_18250 [Oscillibacter valericigenes Sjm18-20]|nr:hypothetical protein OBV_18250 [Oscillibacter valericigenes Sjm18-20]
MSAYSICNLLIKLGRTTGLQEKVNMFYACGQVTDDQYAELTNTLTPTTDSNTTDTADAS